MLNFQLLIADENSKLKEQTDSLVQWCQGFLSGLGLQKISTTDEEVLEAGFLKEINTSFKVMRPYFDYMSEILTTDLNGVSIID